MDTIRIGIIGAGNPGVGSSRGNSYARLCRVLPAAAVVAVFDVVREHAERACAEIAPAGGGAAVRPFDRLEPFLEAGLDVVVVASPLVFHAEQSIAALERGIHVLSEAGEARFGASGSERQRRGPGPGRGALAGDGPRAGGSGAAEHGALHARRELSLPG